jgi:CRP/FNR family transcriptional regulator
MPDAIPNNDAGLQGAASALTRLFSEPLLDPQRRTLPAGTVIFNQDTPADKVYFIHRGQVRLYHVDASDTRLVEILGQEEWFGVGALARQPSHGARAVALVPTMVTEVSVERLVTMLAQRPEQLLELNRQIAAKLQVARDDAARLVFEDCNARLIRTLLNFSRSAASVQHEDEVVLKITHNQLAQAVGVARETVSLALTQLRQQNLLRTGRNQLVFNPEALRKFRAPGRSSGGRSQIRHVEQVA